MKNPIKIVIKKYSLKYYKELAILYQEFETFNNKNDKKNKIETIKQLEIYAKGDAKSKLRDIFLAIDSKSKNIVGYISFYEIKQTNELYLEDIFVRERYRNLGIGKLLISQYLKIGKKKESMALSVYNWNKEAFKFYESLGFKKDTGSTVMIKSK